MSDGVKPYTPEELARDAGSIEALANLMQISAVAVGSEVAHYLRRLLVTARAGLEDREVLDRETTLLTQQGSPLRLTWRSVIASCVIAETGK